MRLRPSITFICCIWTATAFLQADPAAEAYFAGNALYNKGLYEHAAAEYRDFLAKYPGHEKRLHVRLGLALSLYEQKHYAEAARQFSRLAAEGDAPHKERVLNLWGQCLLILGDPAGAEAAFRQSVNRGKEKFFLELPGVAESYHETPSISVATLQDLEPLERGYAGLVEALFHQSKWTDVILVVDEMREHIPEGQYSLRCAFLKGLALYETSRYGQAAEELEIVVSEGERSNLLEHAQFLLAECLREDGRLEKAADHHDHVARQLRGSFAPDALFRLGYIRFEQKRFQKALLDFQDLRTLYRDSPLIPEAMIYEGRSLIELNRLPQARAVLDDASEIDAVRGQALLWLGKSYLEKERFAEAREILKPASDEFRDTPAEEALLFDLAHALIGLGQHAEAATVLTRLGAHYPDGEFAADALRLEAFALHECGRYQESIRRCEVFSARFPESEAARDVAFLRAEGLFFLGENEAALEAYQHFIPFRGSGPYSDKASMRMTQLQARQENWKKVIDTAEPLFSPRKTEPFFAQLDYLVGVAGFQMDDWSVAIRHLERYLQEHPGVRNSDAAYARLAEAREGAGRIGRALEAWDVLIERYPESQYVSTAHVNRGRLHFDRMENKRARADLEAVLEQAPDGEEAPTALYYLGWLEKRAQDREEARQYFRELLARFPRHPLAEDSRFQEASLALELGNHAEALRGFRGFLAAYPKSERASRAIFFEALALTRLGEIENGRRAFQRFLEAYPYSNLAGRAHYELAWTARKLEEPAAAREHYEQVLTFNEPELRQRAEFELAELAFEAGNFNETVSVLDRLLSEEMKPELRARALFRMGWGLLRREQPREAAGIFEKLLDLYPDFKHAATAAYQAGEVRFSDHEYSRAFDLFLWASSASNEHGLREQARLRVGECHAMLNRWDAAAETFADFRRQYPNSQYKRRAALWEGWAMENLKRYESALRLYRGVINSGEPDVLSARAQFQVGECLLGLGSVDEAIRELVKVDALYAYPEWSSRSLLQIGQALIRKGSEIEARERFREVIQRFPGTEEAVLAESLLRQS